MRYAARSSENDPFILLRCIRSMFGLAITSRSGKRRWYALWLARSVERVFCFAKCPNNMFNLAPFGRWTPNRFALGCRLT